MRLDIFHHFADHRPPPDLRATLAQILQNTKFLMATITELETAITELKSAVAQEKDEIFHLLKKQEDIIADLKAQIQNGENPALDKAVGDLQAVTAEITGIVTP